MREFAHFSAENAKLGSDEISDFDGQNNVKNPTLTNEGWGTLVLGGGLNARRLGTGNGGTSTGARGIFADHDESYQRSMYK
jgi:hypothetical protein